MASLTLAPFEFITSLYFQSNAKLSSSPINHFLMGETLRSLKPIKPSKALEPLKQQAGFIAPRYNTASRTADSLLEAGRGLLRNRNPEDLTIQDLCREAGVTTGAFYGRFESKDAFLAALLVVFTREVQERLQKKLPELPLASSLRGCMEMLIYELRQGLLSYSSLLRVLLFQVGRQEVWAPFQQRRAELVERMLPIVEQLIGAPTSEALQLRIRIGFQVVTGTLINAMLHDPGPLRLSDSQLDKELAAVFCGYIETGGNTPASNEPEPPPKRRSRV